MRIVFYSTNSTVFHGDDVAIHSLPLRKSDWEALCRRYPQHEFCIATQPPGSFLVDMAGNELGAQAAAVRCKMLHGESAGEIADEICAFEPDLAIAASFWTPPYDWLPLKDAMIAGLLRTRGIQTICHSAETALCCFDKMRTHALLERLGYPMPKAFFVDHELFHCERRVKDIKANVYKEYILSELQKLRYPVVIKDTLGLSSYSMEVAVSYRQAVAYLSSGRTNGDRLVEEFLEGEQFGTEIYGGNGSYRVMPPCIFSVNKYGITSPKQSVKIGPVTNERYRIPELQDMLQALAKDLHFAGSAQVDLVFSKGSWHIIEINPRLSGMTEMYAASLGISVPALLLETVLGSLPDGGRLLPVMNFKLPIISEEEMAELAAIPFVCTVNQIHNKAAKQEREKGYAELILRSPGTGMEGLSQAFELLAARFPQLMEPVFLSKARELFKFHI